MNDDKLLKRIYETTLGRFILRILVLPFVSKIIGKFMDTKLSVSLIKPFIEKNNVNMEGYEEREYISFNDFFTRKKTNINIDNNKNNLISPCDGYLKVYKIEEDSVFKIKNSVYTINKLIQNEDIAKKYKDGYCLIFRLSPKEYHRYCYIDDGKKSSNKIIKGKLHAVRPVALENYKVYQTNSREWSILKTDNFDEIVQIEVGALLVGKIDNYHESYTFKRGEEKGKFEYGGSTIILLIKNNIVKINKNILEDSFKEKETLVRIGQKIGEKVGE